MMKALVLLLALSRPDVLLPPETPEGVGVVWDGRAIHLILSFSRAFFPGLPDQGLSLEIAFQAKGARPSAGFLNEALPLDEDGRVHRDLVLPVKPVDSLVHLRLTLYDRTRNRTFLRLERTLHTSPLAVYATDEKGALRLPVFTTEDTLRFRVHLPEPGTLRVAVQEGKNTLEIQSGPVSDTLADIALPAGLLRDGEHTLTVEKGREQQELHFAVWGLRGLPDRKWKEILFLLQLAFPDSTFSGFLALPPEARRERFWETWRSTDPNPATPFLEHYALFRRKLREVNRRFGVGTLPGYRTHQGLVFLKYGPPDWVERRPFELDARPSEVWIYDQTPRRMIFVFVDRQGTGVYTLVDTDPPGLFP